MGEWTRRAGHRRASRSASRVWRLVALAAAMAVLIDAPAGSDATRRAIPPPPPRKPQVPADALFFDDFTGGLTARWSTDRDSVWSVHWGALRADLPDTKQVRSFAYAGSEDWGNYAVDFDVCQIRGVDKGVVVRIHGQSGVGVDLRGPGYQDVVLYRREIPLGHARAESGNGMWHHVRVECLANRFRVFLNGELVLDRKDWRNARPGGRIALAGYTGGVGECTVYYDNVLVTRLP